MGVLTPQQAADLGLDDDPAPGGALSSEQAAALGLEDGPGVGTAAVMGAGNAASFGFNDEAGGFLGALAEKVGLTSQPEIVRAQTREGVPIQNAAADAQEAQTFGDRYRANRDEIRGVDAAAREAHPFAYHGAGIAASVANPALAAGRGAGVVERIGTAAGQGALAGAGNSEADSLGGSAWDALAGGVAGGATAGVLEGAGAAIRGAPGRQALRTADALLEKTPAKTVQDRALDVLGGKEGLSRSLKSEGLEKYARKAKQGLELAEEKLGDVGGDIGSIYAKVDEKFPGGVAPRSEVYNRLNALLDGYAEKDQTAKFSALKSMMGKLEQMDEHLVSRGGAAGDRPMSASQIFELKKQLNNIGYQGVASDIPKQDAHQAARDAGEIIRDFLAERVDKATGEAEKLGKLNTKWRELNEVRRVFQAKAERDERMSPSLGQRAQQVAKGLTDAAAIGGALATGHVGAAIAAPLAIRAIPYAPRGMDALLEALGSAARKGGAPADLIQRAINIGIPREMAEEVVRANRSGGDQSYP